MIVTAIHNSKSTRSHLAHFEQEAKRPLAATIGIEVCFVNWCGNLLVGILRGWNVDLDIPILDSAYRVVGTADVHREGTGDILGLDWFGWWHL